MIISFCLYRYYFIVNDIDNSSYNNNNDSIPTIIEFDIKFCIIEVNTSLLVVTSQLISVLSVIVLLDNNIAYQCYLNKNLFGNVSSSWILFCHYVILIIHSSSIRAVIKFCIIEFDKCFKFIRLFFDCSSRRCFTAYSLLLSFWTEYRVV